MSGIISDNVLKQSGLIKAPAGGSWTFLSKATASSSATISFTSGIDDTYGVYVFTFKNIHPATNDTSFTFQANGSGESGYNETITSTHFKAYLTEADGTPEFAYETSNDLAQSTNFQIMVEGIGSDNDQNLSGYLYLFNPSSTTFVKHWMFRFSAARHNDSIKDEWGAGYFNTTTAIDDIQFKMASGNIDAGDICLYGITT